MTKTHDRTRGDIKKRLYELYCVSIELLSTDFKAESHKVKCVVCNHIRYSEMDVIEAIKIYLVAWMKLRLFIILKNILFLTVIMICFIIEII